MGDEYRKAAELAAQDFPSNRLASRAFGQLTKNGFGLLPGSQAREDEFRDGYRDTHRAMSSDTQRVINTQTAGGTSSSTSDHSPNSGNAMSYAVQMGLLSELKEYLHRFDDGLDDVSRKYRAQMGVLDGVMMREDHTFLIVEHLEPACTGIRRVQQWILEGSIPALNAQMAHFGSPPNANGSSAGDLAADLGHGASYSHEQTWHGQVALLQELKAFLGRLEVSLSLFQINYRQKVAGLADVMQDDHAEFVEHQMEPTLSMIQGLREFIVESSAPAIMRIIEQIENRPHF